MGVSLVTGSAHPKLGGAVASSVGTQPTACEVTRFPDGELHVVVDNHVRGSDAYIVQPTSPPADTHVVELLLLADACRRAGAERVTALIPYFGYARQDRRTLAGEAIGARVMAAAIDAAPVDRVVVVDPHAAGLEAMFRASVDQISALPVLLPELERYVGPETVLVAPDLGAVKLVERYAGRLDTPMAVVRKIRLSGEQVRALDVVGEVSGRRPIVVDDMISTGGTIRAAIEALMRQGCVPEVIVAATHGLFVPPIADQWSGLPIEAVLVTDTVPSPAVDDLPVQTVGVCGLLADVIERLHSGRAVEAGSG